MSEFIDAKVESGNYANSSEVVRAGLRALQERDRVAQKPEKSTTANKTAKPDRRKAHPIEDVFDEIRARR